MSSVETRPGHESRAQMVVASMIRAGPARMLHSENFGLLWEAVATQFVGSMTALRYGVQRLPLLQARRREKLGQDPAAHR